MVGYEKKWHEVAEIKPSEYLRVFEEKSDLIIMTTRDSYVDEMNGLTLYVRLLFHTLDLNGPFTEEVYKEKKDLLSTAIGYEITFEEAEGFSSNARRGNRKEKEQFVTDIKRLLRKVPNEIKEDIVTLCLILGSIDGRPTYKVRTFLNVIYLED